MPSTSGQGVVRAWDGKGSWSELRATLSQAWKRQIRCSPVSVTPVGITTPEEAVDGHFSAVLQSQESAGQRGRMEPPFR